MTAIAARPAPVPSANIVFDIMHFLQDAIIREVAALVMSSPPTLIQTLSTSSKTRENLEILDPVSITDFDFSIFHVGSR